MTDYSRSNRSSIRLERLERRQLMAADLEPILSDSVSEVSALEPAAESVDTSTTETTTADAATFDPLDGNKDGLVTAADALMVINEMNRTSDAGGEPLSDEADLSLDYNADGRVTAVDALMVIDDLNTPKPDEVQLFSIEGFSSLGNGCSCGGVGCPACIVAAEEES